MVRKKTSILPKSVVKYFWGDDLSDLDWLKHQDYIIQTILEKGDPKAAKWLMRKISKKKLKAVASRLRLKAKSKNF